jgi:hypothetical protein
MLETGHDFVRAAAVFDIHQGAPGKRKLATRLAEWTITEWMGKGQLGLIRET